VGLGKRGRERMVRHQATKRPSEGGWEKIKREDGRGAGSESFIDVESGGWPVHAPYPMWWALNPGGQTLHLRLLF
jgi:hypothetical protein